MLITSELHEHSIKMGLPQWFSSKKSACSAGDAGLIPGSGRSPGEGNDNPIQYSCLENPLGQRSLAGYSPWGHKVLDTIEVTEQQQQQYKTKFAS